MSKTSETVIRGTMTSEQILLERKLTCEAIDGAMAFGYQNTNPPPSDDHWLAPFWKIGRKQAELEASAAARDLLRELAALRRYDPNNGKRKEPYPARNLTLNVPAELLDRIDELCANRSKHPEGHFLPSELTPPVRRILGMMLWETTPIAGALRAAGREIPRRVEDEQAAALHWLLGFALEHGMDWHKQAAAALHKMTQGIKD